MLAPPMIPGAGPKCVSHNQPTTMTSNSQGKWLNYRISCQSEEWKTNRLLGLFLSNPGRAAVVMQLETPADSTNVKILNEEIKKKKNHSCLICNLVCRAAQQDQQGIKPVLKTPCQQQIKTISSYVSNSTDGNC